MSGPDKVVNEVLKALKSSLTLMFTNLFNAIQQIQTEIIPEMKKKPEIIIIIHKNGDQINISNYPQIV